MTAATSQPSPPITIDTAYAGKVDGGWVAYDYVGNAVGSATLTPTSQFSAIKFSGTLANGDTTLSSNSGTDTGGIASLSISTAPIKNNFTLVGVFRVRGTSGVGVGARSNTDNILLWRNSGNYNFRINNATTAGGAMPLNTTLNYVLASSPSGIYLYVNGTLIASAAASASSANTGVPLELYEDSRGGGGMDLDVSMCVLLNYGAGQTEAQSLSNNPYQIFAASGSGGITGTLGMVGAAAALAFSGAIGLSGSLVLAGGDAVLNLSGGGANAGTLSLAANDASMNLSGGPVYAGSLALHGADSALALSGVTKYAGSLSLAAQDSALSIAGTVANPVSGTIALQADPAALYMAAPGLAQLAASRSMARRRAC